MCSVSFVGDTFTDRFRLNPAIQPNTQLNYIIPPQVTRAEFDALKAEVELMHDLLKAAKLYDEENGEPDCEIAEKVELLKRVAELVGVDLADVFG